MAVVVAFDNDVDLVVVGMVADGRGWCFPCRLWPWLVYCIVLRCVELLECSFRSSLCCVGVVLCCDAVLGWVLVSFFVN